MIWIPIVVFILLQLLLWHARRGKNLGVVGRVIRNSDWHAWAAAVADKEHELAEFRRFRESNFWQDQDLIDKERELNELKAVEPNKFE
jgi:hypothetical protein